MRFLALIAALLILTAAGGYWVLESGNLELSLEQLRAKRGTSDSLFATIDGVQVHYMDQGRGPVVALLHASFLDLRAWDSMAAALSLDFRVIRMDFLLSGLTGPEPDDNYSIERNLELFDGLIRELGVEQVALVGTSSGGIVAFRYAAQNVTRVTRLVLINSAGMPRTSASNPNRLRGSALSRWFNARYKSRDYWRRNLDRNFIEPNEPPDWLVELAYDNGRRDDLRTGGAIFMRNFRTGDPEAILEQVRAPTMILWGLNNPTVMHLEADVFQHWLVNAPTLKKKYPGTGHYAYLEAPETIEADVRAFLLGQLDGELIAH